MKKHLVSSLALACLIGVPGLAAAAPFSFVDPAFTAELVADSEFTSGGMAGITFDSTGRYMYTSNAGSGTLTRFDTQTTHVTHGTTLFDQVATASTGANSWGMATGLDGTLYALGGGSLNSVDPVTLATTLVTTGAGTYGLALDRTTGDLISSSGSSIIRSHFDGSTWSNTTLVSGTRFIDQVWVDPTGAFVAAAGCCSLGSAEVLIYDADSGALVRSISPTNGAPDGLAFNDVGDIFTNNTNGTLSRFSFDFAGGGYASGAVTESLIASGGFYGDLSTVGPDGSWYLAQYGTGYDDGTDFGTRETFNFQRTSIVRFSLPGGGGFVPPTSGGGGGTSEVPEPGTVLLMGTGLAGLALWRRRTGRA